MREAILFEMAYIKTCRSILSIILRSGKPLDERIIPVYLLCQPRRSQSRRLSWTTILATEGRCTFFVQAPTYTNSCTAVADVIVRVVANQFGISKPIEPCLGERERPRRVCRTKANTERSGHALSEASLSVSIKKGRSSCNVNCLHGITYGQVRLLGPEHEER